VPTDAFTCSGPRYFLMVLALPAIPPRPAYCAEPSDSGSGTAWLLGSAALQAPWLRFRTLARRWGFLRPSLCMVSSGGVMPSTPVVRESLTADEVFPRSLPAETQELQSVIPQGSCGADGPRGRCSTCFAYHRPASERRSPASSVRTRRGCIGAGPARGYVSPTQLDAEIAGRSLPGDSCAQQHLRPSGAARRGARGCERPALRVRVASVTSAPDSAARTTTVASDKAR